MLVKITAENDKTTYCLIGYQFSATTSMFSTCFTDKSQLSKSNEHTCFDKAL